jgi:hypothetical protein
MARMNPIDTVEDISLEVQIKGTDFKFEDSDAFHQKFMIAPCYACQSRDHPLLRLLPTTVYGRAPRYEYCCEVVQKPPLYRDHITGHIHLQYSLRATHFAEACGYNEDEAVQRAPHFGGDRDGERGYPPCMDSFMDRVRLICRQHS